MCKCVWEEGGGGGGLKELRISESQKGHFHTARLQKAKAHLPQRFSRNTTCGPSIPCDSEQVIGQPVCSCSLDLDLCMDLNDECGI